MEIWDEIENDPAAGARHLVAEYGDRLHQTAFRVCGNWHDAQDLVTRALIQAVRHIRSYQRKSSFYTWICSILFNLYKSDKRKAGVRAMVLAGTAEEAMSCTGRDVPQSLSADPFEQLATKADASAVRSAIDDLPKKMRDIVYMFYYDDMSVLDIAALVSAPVGTVKYLLHEARSRLRRKLSTTMRPVGTSKGKKGKHARNG